MGTGISAAIPFKLVKHNKFIINEKDFSSGFFDNYDVDDVDSRKIYSIKIEEDFYETTGLRDDDIQEINCFDYFVEIFNADYRNHKIPFIYEHSGMFSVIGCECYEYWLFYSGSYKAYLETYCTLTHMEKILSKTMLNPLAKSIKFGIFG